MAAVCVFFFKCGNFVLVFKGASCFDGAHFYEDKGGQPIGIRVLSSDYFPRICRGGRLIPCHHIF